MKQLTLQRRLARFVLLLLALGACQGSGRVHETPPAAYPDDTPPRVLEDVAPPHIGPAPSDAAPAPPSSEPALDGLDELEAPSAPRPESASPLGHGRGATGAPARQRDGSRRRPLSKRPAPEERPGLATHWGETRYSPARQVDFERSDAERPSALVELHYNDRSGARRMLPSGQWGRAEAHALGGLRVRLVDDAGRTFPALRRGTRVIGVGVPGERYALSIENPTSARFEVVASVDGLDVLDGERASVEKRGYLVGAYSTVVIDGFRRSGAEVAAFRLGDVARSYAASKGDAQHVGVIGFALFEERRPVVHAPPRWRQPWSEPRWSDDTTLRRDADPFPGRYARPPVW